MHLISEIKNINWFSLLVATVTLFTSWTIYYRLPFEFVFQTIVVVLIFTRYKSSSSRKTKLFWVFFFLSLWYFRPMDFDIKGCMTGLFRSLTISSLFLMKDEYIEKAFSYFLNLLAVVAGIGVIFHLLRFTGIYQAPLITTIENNDRFFDVFPFTVYIYPSSMRFSAIFDEPGFLGTISILSLVLDNFDLKKIRNVVLLISGIVTLSFAFYAMLAVMVILISLKGGNYKLPVSIVIIIALMAYYMPDFFESIIERDEIASFGTSASFSDSRGGYSGAMENLNIISSRSFLEIIFGNGYDAPQILFGDNTTKVASSSVFRLIFQMGYLGLLSIILFCINNVRKDFYSILFICFFIFSLYQRPHIFMMIYILILAASFTKSKSLISY